MTDVVAQRQCQEVVAVAGDHHVVAGAGKDLVVAVAGDHDVVAAGSLEVAEEGAGVAEDQVVATEGDDSVIPQQTAHCVRPVGALEGLRRVGSDDDVVVGEVDVRRNGALLRDVDRGLRGAGDRHEKGQDDGGERDQPAAVHEGHLGVVGLTVRTVRGRRLGRYRLLRPCDVACSGQATSPSIGP
jgi:hypothetical protein